MGIAEELKNQTRTQKLGDLILFWIVVLLWPLVLIVLGLHRLIEKGFAFRRLGYITIGLGVITLDAVGATFGTSNWWWCISFVPHGILPAGIGIFSLELLRMKLVDEWLIWYWNQKNNWRRARRE